MKYIKRFENFSKVSEKYVEADTKTAPTKPKTTPGTRPSRPSPIRRDKPSVDPKPKAEKPDLPTASVEDVVKKFINLLNDEGEDIKKYVQK